MTFYVIKYTDHKAKSREEIKENKLKITNEIRAIKYESESDYAPAHRNYHNLQNAESNDTNKSKRYAFLIRDSMIE